MNKIICILLAFILCFGALSACTKPNTQNNKIITSSNKITILSEAQTTIESQNSIDLKFNEYISNNKLSNADLSNNIHKLSLEWENKATEYYKLLISKLNDKDKKTLKLYWDSQIISNKKRMALYKILVTAKYGSGSIGGVELAKFEYQLVKQKALDVMSMYNYVSTK